MVIFICSTLFEEISLLTLHEIIDLSILLNRARSMEWPNVIFNEHCLGRHEIFATAFPKLHNFVPEMDPDRSPNPWYRYKVAYIFCDGNLFEEQQNIATDVINTLHNCEALLLQKQNFWSTFRTKLHVSLGSNHQSIAQPLRLFRILLPRFNASFICENTLSLIILVCN